MTDLRPPTESWVAGATQCIALFAASTPWVRGLEKLDGVGVGGVQTLR